MTEGLIAELERLIAMKEQELKRDRNLREALLELEALKAKTRAEIKEDTWRRFQSYVSASGAWYAEAVSRAEIEMLSARRVYVAADSARASVLNVARTELERAWKEITGSKRAFIIHIHGKPQAAKDAREAFRL